MCGIAGKLWYDGSRPADVESVERLCAALAHRGPDGSGIVRDGPLALGHRRLAIVDLSPRARQPLVSRDGSCFVAVNGEIYNHVALRGELAARGHSFATDCDSEVLLPLYQQWYESEGPDFVSRLDGMFAFALWDARARRLILGRDRAGQKPLVYAQTGEGLVFASELAALALDPLVDRGLDWQALADYLALGVVPQPRTAFLGARKLPPATVAVVEGGRLSLHRTWRLSPGSDETSRPSLDEAAEEVARLLDAAVRRRLMSDVPLGAFLSGGLDSAGVVATMARTAPGPLRTFTIGFADAAYDETAEARKIARLYGTEHSELVLEPDAVGLVDELVGRYGEPFADASAIPTLLVSRLARGQVKVVLTGDGGDESFAGYDRYRALELARRLDRPLAAPLRAALRLAGALVPQGGGRSVGTRLRRFSSALASPPRRRNQLWRAGSGQPVVARLLTPEGRQRLGEPEPYGPDVDLPLPLNEALVLDVERYLPDDILVKLDIASMAHGLEARSPFLDRELMEFASSLPGRYKLGRADGDPRFGRMTSKLVLRRALADRLPPDLRSGRKRGFGVPLDAWFRGPLADHAREVLLSSRARQRGLFREEAVSRLIGDHVRGRVAAHEPLFTLLVLERWLVTRENAA
jgi:asparagine synthase (glutamine-hydrolysing)